MNMHGMPQPGMASVMPVGVSPGMMQQNSPQQPPQMQNVMGSQQAMVLQTTVAPHDKSDPITKSKTFIGPLRESLSSTFKSAALILQQNNLSDNLKKDSNNPTARFDKHLEEFYSICDQIELHLKTAILSIQQMSSSQHYLPGAVMNTRIEPFIPETPSALSYPQYLTTVRAHIVSAKEIHDTLISAAQNISQSD